MVIRKIKTSAILLLLPMAIFGQRATSLVSAAEMPGYAHAVVKPVALSDVRITGGYLGTYIDRTLNLSVLDLFNKMEARGSFRNFTIVAKGLSAPHVGGPNEDEWVYKLLEAAGAFAPQSQAIKEKFQPLINDILASQDSDGYLNSYYQNALVIKKEGVTNRFRPKNRFEFYDFGHFAQAGLAWKRSTGDDQLYKAALKFADLLCDRFGAKPLPYNYNSPLGYRKYEHPNHEMAMVELYRLTGNKKYLDFAAHTLDCYKFWSFPEVWGHCVQENLLLCGGADLYLESGQPEMLRHLEDMWTDIVTRKSYLTGGVGNGVDREDYGAAYVLPNATSYCETCAAISKMFFDWRLLLATGQAKYSDDVERTFYNAVLSGIGLSGTDYFYVNRMESKAGTAKNQRQPYFPTSCCAPNLHRLLGSLQSYLFTVNHDGVQAHLYGDAELNTRLPSGATVHLRETTDYPREERIQFKILADGAYALSLRIPMWTAASGASVTINGQPGLAARVGSYLQLNRSWKSGDIVTLNLAMKPRLIPGREQVAAEKGSLALGYGPLIYCVESPDNPNLDVFALSLAQDCRFATNRSPAVLGDAVLLTGEALNNHVKTPVVAIPYHLWANRGKSDMRVWLPSDGAGAANAQKPMDK